MHGLAKHTEKIFKSVSELSCLKPYTLIGGTALSLQLGMRESEDLDFCVWSKNLRIDKPTVDWSNIEKELGSIGAIAVRDVLGFDQVNFVVDGVKISFIAKQRNLSPVSSPVTILNNVIAADIISIGAMKVELILRRSDFRDYYDIYSILMHGVSLKTIVDAASVYSNRRLKTRDALAFLMNGSNYQRPKGFELLNPVYDIDHHGIESHIQSIIREEYK